MKFIWNFAYGGNMSPGVLIERRGIRPAESVAGCLKDYRLVFNTRGFPWLEPVFANVEPAPGAAVHGVLHRLTPSQLARLDRYEGGGWAYRHLELEVRAYDGRQIRARIYSACHVVPPGRPSRRYLGHLLEGARHFDLDPGYVAVLEKIPCRESGRPARAAIMLFERLFKAGVPVKSLLDGFWGLKEGFSRVKRR